MGSLSCRIDRSDQSIDFFDGQYRRQMDTDARAFEQLGRIRFDILFQNEEAEEALDTADDTRYRTRTDAEVIQFGYKMLKIFIRNLSKRDVFSREIRV